MKRCPYCGEMNMDNAGFCAECGKNISNVTLERVNGYKNPGRPMRRPVGFKMSKNMKIILAQIIVLVIAVTAFCAIGSSKSSPEAAAENYFRALVNRDTEALYEMTVMSDSPFLTPEAMDELVQELNLEAADRLAQVEVKLENDTYSKSVEFVKQANVQYRWKNETDVEYIELTMVEGDGSIMFLFPQWKVKDENFVAKDYSIEVPAGSQLVIDGRIVPDLYIEEEMEASDLYVIDLFRGEHEMTVLTEGLPAQSYTFEAVSEDYFYACDFSLDENSQIMFENLMKENLRRVYEAALSRADASVLADLFTIANGEELAGIYHEIMGWMFEDSDIWLTKLDITGFETNSCYTYESDGRIYAELSVVFDYTYEYVETVQSMYVTGTYSDSDRSSMDARFYLEDGEWKLDYFWMPSYL